MSDNPTTEALADLYRRRDGTMRQCCYSNSDYSFCLRKGCHDHGCHKANEILRADEAKAGHPV